MVSLRGAGGDQEYTSKILVMVILMWVLTPICISLYMSDADAEPDAWQDEIAQLEDEYYLNTGRQVTATTEVWGLAGIYTPYGIDYSGSATSVYGRTPDGWIYSDKVVTYTASQYSSGSAGYFQARLMDNGLYYYTAVSSSDLSHTAATYDSTTQKWDYSNASLYTAVTMDNSHKSTIFFTTSNKTTTEDGYYYTFNGLRYAFSPLRTYETEADGQQVTVTPGSSTLSLIWYQYSSYSGIAGQLAISDGTDAGLSYLTSTDILRVFNNNTYTSTFDMTFNGGVKMHLSIRLDPARITSGMSAEDCYNYGYWSVVVSSDSVASSKVNTASYEFSLDNIWETFINLFSFNLANQYNISGWEGTLISIIWSMPLYAILLSLALNNYIALIGVAILAAIQGLSSLSSWWPF